MTSSLARSWPFPFNASAPQLESSHEWWVRQWPPFPQEFHNASIANTIIVPWSANTFPENPRILRSFQVTNVVTSSLMMGVLFLKIVHTLCVVTPPNTKNNAHNKSSMGVTFALLLSAMLMMIPAIMEAIVLPIIGLDNPGPYRLISLARSWIRLLGILVICAIAHRRAISIKFSWPQSVLITKCVTFTYVFVLLTTRSMATVYEVQMVISDVPPTSATFASQITRTILLLASAIYFIYMEGFVTGLVFWYHDGHAINNIEDPVLNNSSYGRQGRTKLQWRRQCCGTPLARYRNILSTCIVMYFISQAAFQLHTFSSSVLFAPFYGNAWTLFLVRLFDFRFELESRYAVGHDRKSDPSHKGKKPEIPPHHRQQLANLAQKSHTLITGTSPKESCASSIRLLPRDDFMGGPMFYKNQDVLMAQLFNKAYSPQLPPTLNNSFNNSNANNRAVTSSNRARYARLARQLLSDVSNQRWESPSGKF